MRLLHLADTHIGVESYGRIDPATGRHSRLLDFARALDAAVNAALDPLVDAVLFAGDAYRGCDPSPTHQQVFAQAIGRLVTAGVPVVMITGNHDLPVSYGRANALEIFNTLAGDGVRVVSKPELVRLDTASGPLQTACLPWPSRAMLLRREGAVDWSDDQVREALESLCRGAVSRMLAELDPAQPAVLLAHLAVAEAVYSGSERTALGGRDPTLATSELADARLDYVALGHLHRHQILRAERPPVVYAGSPERIDFGEERDTKGAVLVDIGTGATAAERAVTYRQVAVPTRPMVTIEATLGDEPTDELCAAIAAATIADAIVRVRYTCTDEQFERLDLRRVRAALEPAWLLAGLLRERVEPPRRTRVEVTEHQTVAEALARWLDTRPDLAAEREEIAAAGLKLEALLAASDAAGDEDGP